MSNIQPMDPPPSKVSGKTKAGVGIAAMIAIALPIYTGWEGTKTMPYKDIVGKWTVCSGDTRNVVPGKRLTQQECDQRTKAILNEFGEDVQKDSPGIEKSPYEWAGHTIFAANVGMGNYAKSSVRRLYNAGQHRNACRAIRLYGKAGGKVVTGLLNRRDGTDERVGEYELCLVGAIPADEVRQ